MNNGLITFNQIINDSLMPNLCLFGDEKSIRQLNIYIENDVMNKNKNFFSSLSENINDSGIKLKSEIKDEWKFLAKKNYQYFAEPLFVKLNKITFSEPVTNLYFKMSLNCAFSHLFCLKNSVNNETDKNVNSFKIMRSLKDIGQMIRDCREDITGCESDSIIEIIRRVLAFVWLKILSVYHKLIYMEGLSMIKEEVIYHITYRDTTSVKVNMIRESILDELNLYEKKPEISEINSHNNIAAENPPSTNNDIYEIINDISNDLETTKENLTKAVAKEEIGKEYLKPGEACALLNISKTTLNTWRKNGIFKDYHLLGNRYEYSKQELTRLKTQNNESKGNR